VRYYEQLKEGEDFIYEAKVLVVGEPQAGKTTLTQKIRDNDNWHREMKGITTESTVGVNIVKIPFTYNRDTSKEIKAHFWDFGGHRAQYVLHQYFFTESSLYIVLADGRKEFPNFNYWFEIIATLGKGCPVLVVLNENQCQPIQTFNVNEYRREFGAALESIEEKSVNLYDDKDNRFSLLVSEIQNKVSNLKHIGQSLPAKWVRVREDIEKLKESKPYITKDEFLEVCRNRDLTRREYQQQVLEYLHILGIALNYKSDVNLRNKLILRPEWVIDALYVVLKNKQIEEKKGVFEVDYVDTLWEREGYSSTDRDILLGLMQKNSFEIAYRFGSSDKFIVPILLPFKPKDYTLDEINPTQMQIEYTFMPKGILSRLIVRLNKNIVTDDEQIVWNKGVLLEHHNSKAEVIESEQSKQISIKVVGENKQHNKELLTIVRNEIVGIHRDWFDSRLNYEELVPCICEKCNELRNKYNSLSGDEVKNLSDDERKRLSLEPYKLFELEERLRDNVFTVECRKSYKPVEIFKLIQEIYVVKREKHGEMPNINISNIDGNNISLNVNAGIKDSTVRNAASQKLLPVDVDKETD
jgi:small GTP-binding protein